MIMACTGTVAVKANTGTGVTQDDPEDAASSPLVSSNTLHNRNRKFPGATDTAAPNLTAMVVLLYTLVKVQVGALPNTLMLEAAKSCAQARGVAAVARCCTNRAMDRLKDNTSCAPSTLNVAAAA